MNSLFMKYFVYRKFVQEKIKYVFSIILDDVSAILQRARDKRYATNR